MDNTELIENVAPAIIERVNAAALHDWVRVMTLTNKELLQLVVAPVPGQKLCGITLKPTDSSAIKTR
jgi:hypothetical protein